MEYLDKLLERLTGASGVGYSGNIADVVVEILGEMKLTATKHHDGSVHAVMPGSGKKDVMLACHLDEIGYIVEGIGDRGFIRFGSVGHSDPRILIGQEITVHGKEDLPGYICAKPPHLLSQSERNKVIPMSELFIDTGIPAGRLKNLVQVGDMITFRGRYQRLQDSLRSAKSLDNRAGVAAGILALKELGEQKCRVSIHFAATSQEELLGLGARVSANRINPCCAVVVDATFGDQSELAEGECFILESGPAIGRGGTISSKLYDQLVATAKDLEIPYQIEALPTYTGTDADHIAFSNDGVPCGLISIPVRYMHTPVEVVSLKDIERTARILAGFLKRI